MDRTRRLAATLVLAAIVGSGAAQALVVDSGHQGGVTALVADDSRGILVSGGEEGSVSIWNTNNNTLLASFQVSHRPVRGLALHPRQDRVAVLAGTGRQPYIIAVWDWRRARRQFTLQVREEPSYFGFSTQGSYLFYTLAEWESIHIHDVETGRQLPYMSSGFGLVSFLAFSRSERNLMTYQPSGRIVFWETRTGRQIKTIQAPPDLLNPTVLDDFSTMIAVSPDGLVVVDLVTGLAVDTAETATIVDLSSSRDGTRIAGLVRAASGGVALNQWIYRSGSLTQVSGGGVRLPAQNAMLRTVAVTDRDVYLGSEDGTVYASSFYGPARTLSTNHLAGITAVAAQKSTIAVATPGAVLVFRLSTNRFGRTMLDFVRNYSLEQHRFPGFGDPDIAFLDETTFAVWDRSSDSGTVMLVSPSSLRAVDLEPGSALVDLQPVGDGAAVLALHRNGNIAILDSLTWEPQFQLRSPGTQAVAALSGETLVAGRATISAFDRPLLRINTRTGETVPLTDQRWVTYGLQIDARRQKLYSVSISYDDDSPKTFVRLHEGGGLERSRPIIQFAGEDPGAAILFEASRERIYTTLGYEGVRVWDGGRLARLEEPTHIPRDLALADRLLVARNTDSTVSVWDTRTGKLELEFYLFRDLSWLAVLPQEHAYVNNGADRYIIPD
jgi:WD40 repeat protein